MAKSFYQGKKSLSRFKSGENSLLSYYGFTKKDQKKYPVITRILKKLTPERIKKEIEAIQRIKLPPELQKWVREYEKVGERGKFIWKWLYKINQIIILSSISKKYKKSLINNKFLLSMVVFVLDDVIDEKKNKKLFSNLSQFLLERSYKKDNLNKEERDCVEFIVKLWNYIKKNIRKYPRFGEFKDILYYDIAQILNSMDYAYLIHKNFNLINKIESWLYFPNSMQGMGYSTLDLMCSPKFNIAELGITREIICQVQKIIRIGNWISTWERELIKNDFSSGIFAYAIDADCFSPRELEKGNIKEMARKIKGSKIEEKLLKEWEQYYYEATKMGKKLKTIHIKKLLSDLKTLLMLELIIKHYNYDTFCIQSN